MKDPRSLCLSATSLNIFTKCPRLFCYRYLDEEKLYLPLRDNGRLGSQFHTLVQLLTPLAEAQRQLWLDRVDPKVKQWWQDFCRAGLDQVHYPFYSEFPLLVEYQGWQLQARYDRLVVKPDQYQIWDWKTGKQQETWQTVLYPLLLHWGLKIAPQMISVHFWYVSQGETSFTYSREQQQNDREQLDQALEQIDRLDFPQTTNTKTCQDCFFRYHCWGESLP